MDNSWSSPAAPWDTGHHEAIALNRKGELDLPGDRGLGQAPSMGWGRRSCTWSLSPTHEKARALRLGRVPEQKLRRMTNIGCAMTSVSGPPLPLQPGLVSLDFYLLGFSIRRHSQG